MMELLIVLPVLLGYLLITALSFGSMLALILSWERNRSILWAVVHGWLSWFAVIYFSMKPKSSVVDP